MSSIDVKYSPLRSWRIPATTTPIVGITYLTISYSHPANNSWLYDGSFAWKNFLAFVLIDQLAIEFVTYAIISHLIFWYARLLAIKKMSLTLQGWLRYQVIFLPLMLAAFFIFNPVTQSIRYYYHTFSQAVPPAYFNEYFYSGRLYLTYLLPVLMGGYLMLNLNLYLTFRERKSALSLQQFKEGKLEVMDATGKLLLAIDQITHFEKVGRVYYAHTTTKEFRINLNIQDLEARLTKYGFFRINRATLINLHHMRNFSFWENEKYIIRLNNGKEFVSTRERIKKLKEVNTT